jgi:hypothetical protein
LHLFCKIQVKKEERRDMSKQFTVTEHPSLPMSEYQGLRVVICFLTKGTEMELKSILSYFKAGAGKNGAS